MSAEDIRATVAMIDTDGDSLIDAQEARHLFDNLITRQPELGLTEEGYAAWFAALDIDNDGKVTVDEVVTYLVSINYQP